MTPITVYGAPLTRIVRPRTPGDAAKRRRQMASPSTASEPAVGWSSPAAKVRPISGRTPSVVKKPAVTVAP